MTADESLGCGALEGTGLPGVGRSLEERDVISFSSTATCWLSLLLLYSPVIIHQYVEFK